jgi:hypothetical protein
LNDRCARSGGHLEENVCSVLARESVRRKVVYQRAEYLSERQTSPDQLFDDLARELNIGAGATLTVQTG